MGLIDYSAELHQDLVEIFAQLKSMSYRWGTPEWLKMRMERMATDTKNPQLAQSTQYIQNHCFTRRGACVWYRFFIVILVGISTASQAARIDWLEHSLFFAYTPSGFHFVQDRPVYAKREGIAQDLRVLRRYSNGLILYSTDKSTEHILAIAHKLKFDAVILGIWNITDKGEIDRVVALARQYPELVRGIAVGNEGLFWKRYSKTQLEQAIKIIRALLPNIALTTSEPFSSYLGMPAAIDCSNQDFLLPTIHPVFESWFNPSGITQSVEFVDNIVTRLTELCHKDVLVKETGVPSGPGNQSYSEQQQFLFWQKLLEKVKTKPNVSVALFEAFDAPWKVVEIQKQSGKYDEREKYWGWFTQTREPKAVVNLLKVRE